MLYGNVMRSVIRKCYTVVLYGSVIRKCYAECYTAYYTAYYTEMLYGSLIYGSAIRSVIRE